MKSLFLVLVLGLLLAAGSLMAEPIVIETSKATYTREEPQTMEDALKLSRGLASVLNEVIAQYEAENSQATDRVENLLATLGKVDASLGDAKDKIDTAAPVLENAVKNQAKMFFWGAYAGLNPLPLGMSFADAGIQAGANLWNTVVVQGFVGGGVAWPTAVTLYPELRLSVSIWAF